MNFINKITIAKTMQRMPVIIPDRISDKSLVGSNLLNMLAVVESDLATESIFSNLLLNEKL